jgi:CheY-like chemotaxis protein
MAFDFLVVDDDEINLYIMTRLVEKARYKANMVTRTDGKLGVDYLEELIENKETLPKLIFVDINMPGTDGWEFLEKYRELNVEQDIEVYMLTSSVFDIDIEKSKNYEFLSGFISKPITVQQLDEIFAESGAEAA